jgi:hypothetical protein
MNHFESSVINLIWTKKLVLLYLLRTPWPMNPSRKNNMTLAPNLPIFIYLQMYFGGGLAPSCQASLRTPGHWIQTEKK